MRSTTVEASWCRGLGTLMAAVLVAGCTGLAGGGVATPVPSVSVSPEASAAPSSATPSAAPAPSEVSPMPPPSPGATSAPATLRPSAVPEIEGSARYRSVLSFVEPDWGPGRVDLAFQWLRDGRAIAGATGTSYRLAAQDIGRRVSVRITGSRSGFASVRQETEAVGPVLGARLRPATPEVSGSAKVGRTLTGRVDPWGPGTVHLTWQWYRDGQKIAQATGTTYRLVAADLERTITVRVRGSATNFQPELRYSEPTATVAPGVLDPTPVPLYSGTAQVGQTLTALPREWGPGEVTLSYQWYRSGAGGDVRIDGAKRAKYRLVAADAGHRLKVRVSGSTPGFATVRRYSGWTSEVAPGELTPGVPQIAGSAVVGRALTAEPGEWTPAGVALSYRWYRGGLLVTKATGATYTLSGADAGYLITVRVTGKLPGHHDLTVESAPVGPVVPRER
jgi:hypothetical protein